MSLIYKKVLKASAAAVLLFAFLACPACQGKRFENEGSTVLEQNWGRSFEAMKYSQTQNPEAPENLEPVEGIDGRAAQNAMKDYLEGSGSGSAGMSSATAGQ